MAGPGSLDPVHSPRRRHALHVAVLAVGLVALGALLYRTGWTRIADTVVGVGGWFALIAAIDVGSVCCDAAAVHRFASAQHPITYRRVFAAQFSGLAINRLSPGNTLGEPVKVTMLMQHVPEETAISAIVMFNLSSYVVAITVLVIGVPLTVLTLDLPTRIDVIVLAVSAGLAMVALGLVRLARRGALATVTGAARGLRLLSAARAARWTDRIAAIDAAIRRIGDPATRRALVFIIASRVGNMVGTVVLLRTADIPLSAPVVIAMLSVGILITWISNIVPLGLGIADGSNLVLYRALGALPEHGLDFTMINRVRTVLLASIGLIVMTAANALDRER
jgi:hypothetical protein